VKEKLMVPIFVMRYQVSPRKFLCNNLCTPSKLLSLRTFKYVIRKLYSFLYPGYGLNTQPQCVKPPNGTHVPPIGQISFREDMGGGSRAFSWLLILRILI
jgi:hypothetical protein